MLNRIWPEVPSLSPSDLANVVLRLSDYYIKNPEQMTPWNENFCQLAYRYYFLPLNLIRALGIISRGQQVNFFDGLNHFIDWGAGPGTASLAIQHQLKDKVLSQTLIDHSSEVLKIFSDLHQNLNQPKITTETDLSAYLKNKDLTCLIFSYSLTEVTDLPKNWEKFEAIMILEPSTSEDGRKLLELREKIKKQGFHIWAPCTHQADCPLLKESKNDWCHDRFHVNAPDWFQKLESHLPIKNRTVTTSYLLARKKAPPEQLKNLARLIGDSLEEKGKTRQLVCKESDQKTKREFLTWMHKGAILQTLSRGELVQLPSDLELKSNELRVQNQPVKTIAENL